MYDALEARWANVPRKILIEVFEIAIRNVTPAVEVKPKRVGGSTYQVPIDVSHERGVTLAMRWLIQFARDRSGRSMVGEADQRIARCLSTGRAARSVGKTNHTVWQRRIAPLLTFASEKTNCSRLSNDGKRMENGKDESEL